MRLRPVVRSVAAALALVLVASLAQAQGLAWVREHYTKREFYVPMRDGVRLFTQVYAPKDPSQPWPFMLQRTPYSVNPYGADQYRESLGPSPAFAKEGYIFVFQDVRGRWMSEGDFEQMRAHRPVKSGPRDVDESSDTYDTIAWLLANVPGHNGRVGMWGISYPGFYAAAGMIDAHPALKAVSPQAPISDWFAGDDWHHNGALLLPHAFGWFYAADFPRAGPTTVSPFPRREPPTPDGYEFFMRLGPLRNAWERYMKGRSPFWPELMAHDTRDAFWQPRNLRQHLRNITPAVMTVGGWFDAENLFGALEVYKQTEAHSPRSPYNVLVMGPWVHGGWARGDGDTLGDVRFDSKTGEFYREQVELPFFNFFLKDKGKLDLPEALVFETGTNQWRRFDGWPPRQAAPRTFYLSAGGALASDPPAAAALEAFDEYVSDPARPVPYIPGVSFNMAQRYMVDDQRFAARRPDVLVYQTGVLEEDLTVAGPITATLFVSTTGTDSDWVVKVIDVYPDRFPDEKGDLDNTLGGYQQLVRGDVIRGKFRDSLETPAPFAPGEPTKVEFTLQDTLHTFRRGHRLMVQVQSSWFPLIDRNPQTFVKIPDATEADFQKATQRVYRSPALASRIAVGVLPRP